MPHTGFFFDSGLGPYLAPLGPVKEVDSEGGKRRVPTVLQVESNFLGIKHVPVI